ncbi:hypothetical protein [Streptomyces sp. STR69]|uniref:hypothetical protein n=1 Tax=Streptomyces sp. STR69 TaxID=1796942 RepID=UPI0021C6EC7D|nr:hypothetical protein [Streptomyces sp. STR69]
MPSGQSLAVPVNEWVHGAQYVFRGTVLEVGTNNLTGVESDPRMAVVHVEDVLLAPRTLGDLTGSDVTVYVAEDHPVEPGENSVFFGASWHYGAHLGVVEVGRVAADDKDLPSLQDVVLDARLAQLDEELLARLDGAELVVYGRVLQVADAEPEDEDEPADWDAPEWHTAEVRVGRILKGSPPPHIRVAFPLGGDRSWEASPQYFAGQEGVWLLSRAEERPDHYSALDPLDFHAASDVERISTLLWIRPGRSHTRGPAD